MKPHPSGRPIRSSERRDYSMKLRYEDGYRCPRLNRPVYKTEAVGFIHLPMRDDLYLETEARARKETT